MKERFEAETYTAIPSFHVAVLVYPIYLRELRQSELHRLLDTEVVGSRSYPLVLEARVDAYAEVRGAIATGSGAVQYVIDLKTDIRS